MARWSLTPPLPGESAQDALARLAQDLNLILAEQEQDALEIRAQGGYTAKFAGNVDMQGHRVTNVSREPLTDDEPVTQRYLKRSGKVLYADDKGDTFVTKKRIVHQDARGDQDSVTLKQLQNLLAATDLKTVPFLVQALTPKLTAERVLTAGTNITLADAGPNTTLTVSVTPVLTSGVYTPTLTNLLNLTASTAFECQYLRLGSTVLVSGLVNVTPTTTATSTRIGISLPIASNIGAAEDCCGVAFSTNIAGQGAGIFGAAANDRAHMQWMAVDVTNQAMYFILAYQVI